MINRVNVKLFVSFAVSSNTMIIHCVVTNLALKVFLGHI